MTRATTSARRTSRPRWRPGLRARPGRGRDSESDGARVSRAMVPCDNEDWGVPLRRKSTTRKRCAAAVAANDLQGSTRLDAPIDSVASLLRIYGRGAFDTDEATAREVDESCSRWVARIVSGDVQVKKLSDWTRSLVRGNRRRKSDPASEQLVQEPDASPRERPGVPESGVPAPGSLPAPAVQTSPRPSSSRVQSDVCPLPFHGSGFAGAF